MGASENKPTVTIYVRSGTGSSYGIGGNSSSAPLPGGYLVDFGHVFLEVTDGKGRTASFDYWAGAEGRGVVNPNVDANRRAGIEGGKTKPFERTVYEISPDQAAAMIKEVDSLTANPPDYHLSGKDVSTCVSRVEDILRKGGFTVLSAQTPTGLKNSVSPANTPAPAPRFPLPQPLPPDVGPKLAEALKASEGDRAQRGNEQAAQQATQRAMQQAQMAQQAAQQAAQRAMRQAQQAAQQAAQRAAQQQAQQAAQQQAQQAAQQQAAVTRPANWQMFNWSGVQNWRK
jgi:hypothetical protein